ncbi:MAG TPA: NAD-dependent epimerase/dehydratase family protein [Actinomycetota bacterium]
MSGHVVVTGVAGFVGSHLAEGLVAAGYRVVGIDAFTPYYPPEEKRANLAELLGHPAFELVEGDLGELALEGHLAGTEVVFHPAAQPGVRGSWGADFAIYVRHNITATQRLLEACARAGVPRLVAASSSSVYGDAPSYPTTESSATRPVSPYGVTKLASEHLCLAYAQPAVSGMTVTTLRYFTVYGPRQRPDMGFRRFLEAAYQGRPITVYGDGQQTRDFTHVSDVVRANLLAMTAPVNGEAINVGGGRRVTLDEVLDLVGRTTGRRLRIRRLPAQPGDARHTGADGTRAEALLGYLPEVGLAEGLAGQAAWIAARRAVTRTPVR